VIDGLEAVSITKSDIANWLISKAQQAFHQSDIKALRDLHFDDRKLLASILKDTKDENNLPEPLKRAIREHFGLSASVNSLKILENVLPKRSSVLKLKF
jgi:hypothetical protein